MKPGTPRQAVVFGQWGQEPRLAWLSRAAKNCGWEKWFTRWKKPWTMDEKNGGHTVKNILNSGSEKPLKNRKLEKNCNKVKDTPSLGQNCKAPHQQRSAHSQSPRKEGWIKITSKWNLGLSQLSQFLSQVKDLGTELQHDHKQPAHSQSLTTLPLLLWPTLTQSIPRNKNPVRFLAFWWKLFSFCW